MDTMTVQDPPELRPEARTTEVADGAEIAVRANHTRAYLALYASIATVQVGVCLTRDELVAHRDACNAVLIASEPSA